MCRDKINIVDQARCPRNVDGRGDGSPVGDWHPWLKGVPLAVRTADQTVVIHIEKHRLANQAGFGWIPDAVSIQIIPDRSLNGTVLRAGEVLLRLGLPAVEPNVIVSSGRDVAQPIPQVFLTQLVVHASWQLIQDVGAVRIGRCAGFSVGDLQRPVNKLSFVAVIVVDHNQPPRSVRILSVIVSQPSLGLKGTGERRRKFV